MKGAPIRFIVAVVGGWTCVRVAVLLPDAAPLVLAGDVLAPRAEARGRQFADPESSPTRTPATRTRSTPLPRAEGRGEPPARHAARPAMPVQAAVPAPTPRPAGEPGRDPRPPILVPATLGSAPGPSERRRWSASAWLLARGGAGGTLSGGQLGASQAGARVLYRIDAEHRLSLAGRVAAPLKGAGAEAAIGLDWQPTTAPLHIVAEQRFGLDGGRGGPTAMAIGGLNPTPVALGFRLEAYGQAGAILRGGRVEAFGDGALRLTRTIATPGRATLDLGVGAWGAGQRGAARADIGPTVAVALPLAGRGIRLSLDWRQRVAGQARPGSGPALSIGSDF